MTATPALRRAGVHAALGFGLAGVLAGVFMLGPWASLLLMAITFVLVWPAALVVRSVGNELPFGSPVTVGVLAACGLLALPGLVRLISWGVAGLLFACIVALLAVLAGFVPSVRRPRSRRHAGIRELAKYVPPATGEGGDARGACPLSVEELCRVWRESGAALRDTTDARDRETVAEVRRLCLDELERRNPDGFRRWIETDATSDPEPFVLQRDD